MHRLHWEPAKSEEAAHTISPQGEPLTTFPQTHKSLRPLSIQLSLFKWRQCPSVWASAENYVISATPNCRCSIAMKTKKVLPIDMQILSCLVMAQLIVLSLMTSNHFRLLHTLISLFPTYPGCVLQIFFWNCCNSCPSPSVITELNKMFSMCPLYIWMRVLILPFRKFLLNTPLPFFGHQLLVLFILAEHSGVSSEKGSCPWNLSSYA